MERVLARRLVSLVPESQTGLERLIDKKKKSYDLQLELDAKKRDHELKMKRYKAKAEEIEERNLENQREVVANDAYVRDNCNKRMREEERLNLEKKAVESKQKELEKLKEELEELNHHEEEIKTQLETTLPYKSYLDTVYDAAPELFSRSGVSEVQGIVNKYETLKEWRGTLQVRLQRSKKELQKLQDAIKMYDESSTSSTVEIDYQIKKISQAQDAAFKEFGHERHSQELVAIQSRLKGQECALIRLSIDNMYKIVSDINEKTFLRGERQAKTLEEKFDQIAIVIGDMLDIRNSTKNYKLPSKQQLPGISSRRHTSKL
ncbi:hypothetical protein TVAG_100480 [Trichomonas vaginalis G3]|uniref:DUF4200 domain-containing protein n=1 Tax=Trichomonas vaginalis (strain ATCC PRA-98 / G3) TaxID=412133 RepID=A2ENM5_TRIV3|nr:DUF4200 domain family [Trichomonas vaginalis G3]EAY05725.1 hypothetical protein TVAG_100480 [Trichomonas vaginalis G3]KAI5535166.1 DUF4200 domain family [Trichomonas vaginalis G3]|eukprot:XP_001317948.1 hypothetical protein [Trichomonas vaginalis G3]